jgi:hypothetical protein
MSEPDLLDQPAPPPPKRRRWLLWLGVAVLVLFTACGGFHAVLVYTTEQDVREAEAEADRLEPDGWRLDEIEAQRKVLPDKENAALVVQAVKAKLPASWPKPRPAPAAVADGGAAAAPPPAQQVYVATDLGTLPPEVQLDDALLRDLRDSLKAAGPEALDEARALYRLRDGRFPLTYSRDIISTTINSQDARTGANLLQLEAALLAQEGKPDAALEATRGILVSGRSVGDEPMLISALVRIACYTMAVQALERVLAQGEPSPDELTKAQELLEAEAAEPLLLNAARGERASLHELMKRMKSGEVKLSTVAGPGGAGSVADFAGPTLARGSHSRVLRLMTEYVEITKLPPEKQAEPIAALERQVKQAKVEYDVVTALVMPAVIKVNEANCRGQAYLRCAVVAVAAERYRREHKGWPASIEELVPHYLKAVPTDPYDGQPLRYKRLADGVLVYSVGPDLQDDGGARNRANPLAKGTDLGFRLWDVDKRRQPAAEVLGPPDEALRSPDEAPDP